jgi:pyruvate/2-oxoglutarate dehydrogenase complex dihydrolipoamide dehydrogenase (E3) component
MSGVLTPDLCVIGAGSGGLSVAAGAVQMGASVVLIERHLMGGDCLNFGCVPSKSLIAAAQAAAGMRRAGRFGIAGTEPRVDAGGVRDHIRGVIEQIRPHDSVERFEGLGCTVILAEARFTAPDTVVADGRTIKARRFVIATGSVPAVPPIAGLAEVPYLTNETVFDLAVTPAHLIVIGGGPIGLEIAQAHRRLGARVTVLEAARILPKDDPDLAEVIRQRLTEEGIEIREGAGVDRVERTGDGVAAVVGAARIEGSHLLVAAGRKPQFEGLDLAAAGIGHTPKGITVDRRLRTTNPHVFAIGDAAGGPAFTHMAGHHAGVVIQNALFRLPAKVNQRSVPWVTYTDPELAQIGLTEAEARAQHGDAVRSLWEPFTGNDRARAERATEGGIKLVATKQGRVLGVGIVGAHAGELLLPWSIAIDRGLKLKALAAAIVPYPTLSEISKRAAGQFYTPALYSPRVRWLVRWLAKLG